MTITVILVLYNAVINLIAIIGLSQDHPLLFKEEAKEKIDEQEKNLKDDE